MNNYDGGKENGCENKKRRGKQFMAFFSFLCNSIVSRIFYLCMLMGAKACPTSYNLISGENSEYG